MNPCAIPRASYDRRSAVYRDLSFRILKDYPAVKVIDPVSEFCDEKSCWAMKNGKLLYVDDDHPSIHGARLIMKAFTDLVRQPTAR